MVPGFPVLGASTHSRRIFQKLYCHLYQWPLPQVTLSEFRWCHPNEPLIIGLQGAQTAATIPRFRQTMSLDFCTLIQCWELAHQGTQTPSIGAMAAWMVARVCGAARNRTATLASVQEESPTKAVIFTDHFKWNVLMQLRYPLFQQSCQTLFPDFLAVWAKGDGY